MLENLFGNKSIEKILLFLFVNRQVYATQLHQSLSCALTPIQKALQRLENGGIITSYCQGKTRLYTFSPSYPLLPELEELLKKAYSLLSPQDKKRYSYVKQQEHSSDTYVLFDVWKRLNSVRHLAFHATSKSKSGWNGNGKATIETTKEGPNVLIFHEKGSWIGKNGHKTDFSNVFRWTLDSETKVLSLEHLRHGIQNPVFLFHLAPAANHCLSSIDSHLCKDDAYFGKISLDNDSLRLTFRVIGPKKNEEIQTYYT